jgi:restriction endonuclease Mrr
MTNSALNNIEHIKACQNKTVDQLLDTVLTKVGYGTFHKKLLVSTFFLLKKKKGGE